MVTRPARARTSERSDEADPAPAPCPTARGGGGRGQGHQGVFSAGLLPLAPACPSPSGALLGPACRVAWGLAPARSRWAWGCVCLRRTQTQRAWGVSRVTESHLWPEEHPEMGAGLGTRTPGGLAFPSRAGALAPLGLLSPLGGPKPCPAGHMAHLSQRWSRLSSFPCPCPGCEESP